MPASAEVLQEGVQGCQPLAGHDFQSSQGRLEDQVLFQPGWGLAPPVTDRGGHVLSPGPSLPSAVVCGFHDPNPNHGERLRSGQDLDDGLDASAAGPDLPDLLIDCAAAWYIPNCSDARCKSDLTNVKAEFEKAHGMNPTPTDLLPKSHPLEIIENLLLYERPMQLSPEYYGMKGIGRAGVLPFYQLKNLRVCVVFPSVHYCENWCASGVLAIGGWWSDFKSSWVCKLYLGWHWIDSVNWWASKDILNSLLPYNSCLRMRIYLFE